MGLGCRAKIKIKASHGYRRDRNWIPGYIPMDSTEFDADRPDKPITRWVRVAADGSPEPTPLTLADLEAEHWRGNAREN
jgi:hypothetical protein